MEASDETIDRTIDRWGKYERAVEVPFVFKHLPDPPATILDIGCVGSNFLAETTTLGFNAYGIDIRAIDQFGGQSYDAHPKFVLADGRKIPFQDNFFDAVIAISTIEHAGSNYLRKKNRRRD